MLSDAGFFVGQTNKRAPDVETCSEEDGNKRRRKEAKTRENKENKRKRRKQKKTKKTKENEENEGKRRKQKKTNKFRTNLLPLLRIFLAMTRREPPL